MDEDNEEAPKPHVIVGESTFTVTGTLERQRADGWLVLLMVSVSVFVFSVVSAALLIVPELFASRTPLEGRIADLSGQLDQAARVIGEAEQEIEARRELVQQLADDQARYEELSQLNQAEVEAVAQTLQGELTRAGRRSFWEQVAVNAVFLVLGILLDRFLLPFVARLLKARAARGDAAA